MFTRKIISFICTIIISAPIIGFCFMLIEGSTIKEVPGLIAFTSMYAITVVLLFGVPVSILSDKLTYRFKERKRALSSLFIHLLFGLSFIILFMLIMDSPLILTNFNGGDLYFLVPAIIIPCIVWGMDEILRKKLRK